MTHKGWLPLCVCSFHVVSLLARASFYKNNIDIRNGLNYNKNVKSLIYATAHRFFWLQLRNHVSYILINHASAQFYAEWEHFL